MCQFDNTEIHFVNFVWRFLLCKHSISLCRKNKIDFIVENSYTFPEQRKIHYHTATKLAQRGTGPLLPFKSKVYVLVFIGIWVTISIFLTIHKSKNNSDQHDLSEELCCQELKLPLFNFKWLDKIDPISFVKKEHYY